MVLPFEAFEESAVNRGNIPRESLRVIPHSPDIAIPAAPAPSGAPRIGNLGYLDSEHGSEVFIEAAARLNQAGKMLNWLILGEGPNEMGLRRKVRESGLTDCFTIAAPTVPDIAAVLSQLAVHVSCTQRGGPGWAACQALGMGVPSILSSVSSSITLVEDGRSGLLVERGNAIKLAEKIMVLLDKPEASAHMGQIAREEMLAAQSEVDYALRIQALYEQVLNTVGTPSASSVGTTTRSASR